MPRRRTTKISSITREDLIYYAGIFESSLNLRGVGTQGAMAISSTEAWPRRMAKTYGGHHDEFQSGKTEKWYWGWYLSLERRLELLNMLEEAGVAKEFTTEDFEKARFKMEKSINSKNFRDDTAQTSEKVKQQQERRAERMAEMRAEADKRNAAAKKDFEG